MIHIKHLGRIIKQERRKAGFTQLQLAELTGFHQSAISRLESGKFNNTIRQETYDKLKKIIDLHAEIEG